MAGEQTMSWHKHTQMQEMGVAVKQSVYTRHHIVLYGPETRVLFAGAVCSAAPETRVPC